jgi:YVTN family beta-propeller protein
MSRLVFFRIAVASLTITFVAESSFCGNDAENSIAPPGVIFELLALNRDLPTVANPKYLSPIEIVASPDSQRLYIAEKTAKQVAIVDCKTKQVLKTIKLPNEVTGIAAASDGEKIYVTCSSDFWPMGMVCEVDVTGGKVLRRFPAGHCARAPVMNPDGKTLYVCNQFNSDISVIDIASGKETARIPVVREPYSAGITPDGSSLVVANSLPVEKATDTSKITCKVSLVSTVTRQQMDTIGLPLGSHSVFGLTISPDGNYAFVTHLVAMFTLPALHLDQGWIHTNNFAVIDIKEGKLLNDFSLDMPTNGSGNPWGIACTKDSKMLCVAHSGSNELSVIDYQQMMELAKSGTPYAHNLNVLYTLRQKVPVKGKAPRAIAVIGNTAYTAGYFDDNMEIFTLSLDVTSSSGAISLGPAIPFTGERKGEFHFFDGSICQGTWQSCQSCHPLTRPDALNWTLNSDNSFPKNVKSMLYSWWTPPTSWAGKRPRAGGPDGSIRSGISAELFIQPTEEVGVPMDTFFMKMKPVPSPLLIKGTMSQAAVRGKALFTKIGCNTCHPAPLYTDLSFHNAGVVDLFDANTQWDTPSLIEAWRTSPYGHLGSYDFISEIIKLRAHSIGATKLTQEELNDLIEFVSSL